MLAPIVGGILLLGIFGGVILTSYLDIRAMRARELRQRTAERITK